MDANPPTVSVIIPARHAAESLPRALDSIEAQDYPNIVEVVVAAADPETVEAVRDRAKVVDNPFGSTPHALNRAIAASEGDVIVRCDAQSVLPVNYVSKAVDTLTRSNADNVGGMQVPVGKTSWEKAIARAMSSRYGAGDARYRIGGDPGPVETVYLGVFRRETLEKVGGFDERFTRTQDYELNHRIIASGGLVWFDPELRVEYRPRGTLGQLARQYFDYGAAKRRFGKQHPGALRWRQLAPPMLLLSLATALLVSLFWPPAALVIVVYALVLLAVSLPSWRATLALATMHLSWGAGFLIGGSR